ncbi:MAG: hypothetical protein LUD51_03420 [Clostridia bacterium]|nr:hypothetical protein [Clostridia bacterium]
MKEYNAKTHTSFVKFDTNESGNYTDGNIMIFNLETWLNKTNVTNQNGEHVEVPDCLSCHCEVTNLGDLIKKLTLIITSVDDEGYNFGTIKGSIECFDGDESWEFYGRSENLGYYDPADKTTGDPSYSRIRGEDVVAGCADADGWQVKVYAIEEFADFSSDDSSGSLGTKG